MEKSKNKYTPLQSSDVMRLAEEGDKTKSYPLRIGALRKALLLYATLQDTTMRQVILEGIELQVAAYEQKNKS